MSLPEAHSIFGGISCRHVAIVSALESVSHIRLQQHVDVPLDEIVLAALSPDATNANLALAMLMKS